MEFLEIGIIGAIISIIIQIIKEKWGTESDTTKVLTIGLSIVIGSVYYFLQGTALWQSILGVLATASTFYALIIRK